MDFGRLESIKGVDFKLPPDHPMTTELFKKLKPKKKEPVQLYVGCAKWGREDWIGKVYPKGTKAKDFLSHYVQYFNCIELNALFYNLQPKNIIERWASLAGDDFRFCPKYSNSISHLRQLRNAEAETDKYIDHMQSFGNKLGPCFLQLSERFAPNRFDVIENYLKALPSDFRTVVELRNESWFTKDKIVDDMFNVFKKLGIGTVITDTSGRRDILHMRLTTPVAFIRWVGNDLDPSDFKRIDSWVKRIKTWMDEGLKEIYFFIHNHDEKHSPELAKYAIEQFNKHCGTTIKVPRLLNDSSQGKLNL
jgi:uncharacterized protein YecE (DUF72 family)